jgi:hypothetical protein
MSIYTVSVYLYIVVLSGLGCLIHVWSYWSDIPVDWIFGYFCVDGAAGRVWPAGYRATRL